MTLTIKKIVVILLISCFLASLFPYPTEAAEFNRNYIISDQELVDWRAMTLREIEEFLTYGPGATGRLAILAVADVDGKMKSAAEIIKAASERYKISPQVLLALLQREQSLVTKEPIKETQLTWATGFTCYDYGRPVSRFGGFAIQVDRAAWRFRYYLEHPWEFRHRVGITSYTLDKDVIIPQNQATAGLYNYAPHVWDNYLFWKIWQKWFGQEELRYSEGSLLKTEDNPGVWLIQNSQRRPFFSRSVFLARFSDKQVKIVLHQDLADFPIGPAMEFSNYSLLRTPNGNIYLLVDGTRRLIISMEIFKAIGFNMAEVIEITEEEIAQYALAKPISSPYPNGALLQDKSSGAIYYVKDETKYPLWHESILWANFPYQRILLVDPKKLEPYHWGEPIKFRDGTLVKTSDNPSVYLISQGDRRPIASEETFQALGYQWETIIETPQNIIELHPLGPPLDINTLSVEMAQL